MTRYSDPTNSPGSSLNRFLVWDGDNDQYLHTQLAANWDKLDAMFGNPNGVAWPPDEGVNGGVYKQIKLLQKDRQPIGEVFPWFRPGTGVPVPDGCKVCDGSFVAAIDHDFPSFSGAFYLPDLRNRFVLGASTASVPGAQANPAVNTPSGAPGMVLTSNSGNAGDGGGHSTTVSFTVPKHHHKVLKHHHPIDDHQHQHYHIHRLADPYTGMLRTNYVIYELKNDAIFAAHYAPHDNWAPQDDSFPPGTGHFVPHILHFHPVGGIDTGPARDANSLTLKPYTNFAGNGNTFDNSDVNSDDNTDVSLSGSFPTQPRYTGLIYLMRVKYATTI